MAPLKVTLLTGRSLSQGRSKEQGKLSDFYFQSVACCEISDEDLKKIQINPGQNVRIATEHGSVVVKAVTPTQTLNTGVVFMPYSIWATQVSGCDTDGTGMPSYKGVPAIVRPAADERVLTLEEITKKSFGKDSVLPHPRSKGKSRSH